MTQEQIDAAYLERNQVVAGFAHLALMLGYRAGIAKTAIEGWDPAWHGCVYIDLPTGQVSWHYHDREAHLFSWLLPYDGAWDGHTTPEKYQRLADLREKPGTAITQRKPTVEELEKILRSEGEDAITILPNGEVRNLLPGERQAKKPLTMRENLGGEYGGPELNRAIAHALNYHGIDAKLSTPDWQIADLIEGEVQKWLDGTTDVQRFERMTPEERARIGQDA